MSDRDSQSQERVRPAAPAKPTFDDDAAVPPTTAVRPVRRPRLLDRFRGFSAAAQDGSPDDEGRVLVPPRARTVALPRLPGQDPAVGYTLVTSGLAMPPGGAGYLVEHPSAQAPGGKDGKTPVRAAIVAYIDGFGRGFSTGSIQVMPPARTPDVQFKHYTDSAAHNGCVEVATGGGRMARLAEYDEDPKGALTLVGARVQLGEAASVANLPAAVAVAFLALWLFPRVEGVSLNSVSVRDIAGHLRTANLFEALDGMLADLRVGEDHPLLAPPGILAYLAHGLRAAGLEGLKAADLVPTDPWDARGPEISISIGGVNLEDAPTGSFMASLRAAIEASGIPGLAMLGGARGLAEPKVRLVRTTAYANAFYVGFDRRQVSAEGARKLLEAESLLNRFVLMEETLDGIGALQSASLAQVSQLDAWLIDQIAAVAEPYLFDTATAEYHGDTGSTELDVRFSFARGCESLRLPFRLEYGFRFDSETETLVVDVECPSSVLMPRAVWDPATSTWDLRPYADREALASRYALHLMVVVAAVGFWAGERVQQVAVNCWHGLGAGAGVDELVVTDDGVPRGSLMNEPACVATAVFERARFRGALATPEARDACTADPFAFVEGARHSFSLDRDGHLGPVRPLMSLEDPALHPEGSSRPPELDDHGLTERGAALLHAKDVNDLSIYENTVRRAAADEVVEAFRYGGDKAALDTVKDIHDRTENLLLRGTCLQVSEGIANGVYTGDSKTAITEALCDIYGFQKAMKRAQGLSRYNPRGSCDELRRIVATADEQGWFTDTPTRRYRYFDSYASRMVYSLRCPEVSDGRELRLVPDEYYLAHYRLASILADSLSHSEQAIAHARRCVELAPSVAASHLRLARCYFCAFDYTSEIEALREALRVAWSPADVGMALYWLGYALCMVDDYDAGVACYQASPRYDPDLAEPCAAEIADFSRRRSTVARELSQAEEHAVLQRAGVDLDGVKANVAFLVKAAGAAVDAQSYALARNLLSSAEMSLHDDAMPPILESLED